MTLDPNLIDDPEGTAIPIEDERPTGHWYPIEVDILRTWYAVLGAQELSLNWIPEKTAREIEHKARQLHLA